LEGERRDVEALVKVDATRALIAMQMGTLGDNHAETMDTENSIKERRRGSLTKG
jgi:hypothetical protein